MTEPGRDSRLDGDMIRDLLLVVGFVLVTAGVTWLSRPSGLIVSGSFLLYLGVWHK